MDIGGVGFCSAYSGGVGMDRDCGDFHVCSAYSGFVGTVTIVRVSFRTGAQHTLLRKWDRERREIVAQVPRHPSSPTLRDLPPHHP